jgi:glycosyltransferase involved in cell wall biosynthesis
VTGRDYRILAVATQGAGGDDEARLRTLLGRLPAEFFPFDRKAKRASARALLRTIRRDRPDLVVMEGTGIGGGLALMLGRLTAGVPYVISSGDAVGPFVRSIRPAFGPAFDRYERRLCRHSAGFIGWSPYLTGRALTFGAPRAMTAAGWAPFAPRPEARDSVRRRLGIPPDALVFGIVGSLAWNRRVGYAYGLELVEAVRRVERSDVRVVIVGDGDGRPRLDALAERSGGRCILTGRVPRDEVPAYLAAFDVASLPQSLDAVGMFRYTTKISEYLAAGLPVATGRLPFAYDLDGGWLWRLEGVAPWSVPYHESLARLMDGLTPGELAQKRAAVPRELPEFDRDRQVARTTAFLLDILEERKDRSV